MTTTEVDLPYAGTSGWSGSSTSEERALDADLSGVTAARQVKAITCLYRAGTYGVTWHDLADALQWHHGTASGVLSTLHLVGRCTRLVERRGKSQVYVLPEFVDGRETLAHGVPKRHLTDEERSALVRCEGAVRDGYTAGLSVEDATLLVAALRRVSR